MANKKLRALRSLRLALSVLAVILFCLGVVSGILAFSGGKPSVPSPEPTAETATEPPTLPPSETTTGTEAPDPDSNLTEGINSEPNGIEKTNPSNSTPGGSNPGGNTPKDDNPVDPVDPVDPVEPVDPVDPVAPVDPVDPADPVPEDDLLSASSQSDAAAGDSEAAGGSDIIGSTESAPVPEAVTESTMIPVDTQEFPETPVSASLWKLLFQLSICLLVADLAAIGIVSLRIRELKEKQSKTVPNPNLPTPSAPGPVNIGTLHCQGRRQYQQDSLGHSIVLDGRGVLAVVADGMGGLKDGDKVSQQVVLRTLELGGALRPGQENGALLRILKTVNEEVNRFLTPDGLYKSGSTVVAVLVSGDSFQWLSVGDSRIYLYRAGYVNQLNRDHDLLQDWMPEILDGRRSMEASRKDPDGRKLTSFIGMGQLKYVDRSLHPIQIMSGDRIVLLSDGVYGQIPDEQIAEILRRFPDVRQAAQEMDRCVRATQNPHQDNYTALILGF